MHTHQRTALTLASWNLLAPPPGPSYPPRRAECDGGDACDLRMGSRQGGRDELPENSGREPRRPGPAVECRDPRPQPGRDELAPAVRGQVPGHGSAVPDHGRGQNRPEAAIGRGPV